jgi:FkbM family methyltransferase
MQLGRVVNSLLGPLDLRIVRASRMSRIEESLSKLSFLPNVWGHGMHVDPLDRGLPVWRLVGSAEPNGEDAYFARTIEAGQRVVDIGANIGLYTLLFARLVGNTGAVIAIEPGPKSFDLLKRNIAENSYENIRAENAAVADRSGTIDLFVCRSGESDNRIAGTLVDHDQRDKVSVRCATLDEIVGREAVDFIKMDAQGAEFMILQGAQQTLRENAGLRVLMEYSPGGLATAGSAATEFLSFIEAFGFNVARLNGRGEAEPVTRKWLLEDVGSSAELPHANILLTRGRV